MDELKHGELVNIVVDVDTDDEVEGGIPAVDYFVLPMLKERTLQTPQEVIIIRSLPSQRGETTYLVLSPGQTLANKFTLERDPFLDGKAIIVLGQARLALFVHHENELNHRCKAALALRHTATQGVSRIGFQAILSPTLPLTVE